MSMCDLAGNVDVFHINGKRTRCLVTICTDILLPWPVLRKEEGKQHLIEGVYDAVLINSSDFIKWYNLKQC